MKVLFSVAREKYKHIYLICTLLIPFIYSIHINQVFSFVCVLTWSLLGVKKSLGHAQIGLLLGFNSKFPTSIPTPFIHGFPPPPPPRAGSSRRCQLSKPHLKYRMKKIYVSRSFVECVRGRGERQNGFKTESTTELSNFHFWWTKPLYQNKLSNIAFFFRFFKG